MKSILQNIRILLAFVFLLITACTSEEYHLEHYDDGSVRARARFKNGKQHGMTYFYYPNGSYEIKESYKDGLLDGLSERFYENGNLKEVIEWENGEIDGWARSFHPNGQVKSEVKKRNGQFEGEYRKYSPEGKLLQKEIFGQEGKAIYLWYLIDVDKNLATSSVLPVIKNERDTVMVGETFKTTVNFGYELRNVTMFVASSVNQQGKIEDTLAVVEPTPEGKFIYSFVADKLGENTYWIVFSQKVLPGDTLSANGIKQSRAYFVKEREKR